MSRPLRPFTRVGHQRRGGTWHSQSDVAVPRSVLFDEVPRDPSSGWYLPETFDQWRILLEGTGILPPTSVWLCQEAAPPLRDPISSHSLTATGGPSFGVSVPGWSRSAVRYNASADGFFSQADSIGDIQSNSHLLLTVSAVLSTPGTLECVSSIGGQVFIVAGVTGSVYEMKQVGTGINTSGSVDQTHDVRPVMLMIDITNNVQLVQTDQETVTATAISTAGNSLAFLEIGPDHIGDSTQQVTLYAALWRGHSAEMTAVQRSQLISLIKYGR